MNALVTLHNITTTKLIYRDLKYCLVDIHKIPYKIDNTKAKPNSINDFVDIEDLFRCNNLYDYAGIGISIQASNICAIDVDHCFSIPFDINSGDKRANDILNRFKHLAYCEFSFSGTGLRVLFDANLIDNYSDKYYTKNEKNQMEFYQKNKSFRYVTITGRCIYDNEIQYNENCDITLKSFLNDYMLKPEKKIYSTTTSNIETKTIEELLKKNKYHILTNTKYQDIWFSNAPGSGADESERDYFLISYMYENITKDKNKIKTIFESSPYFKSKDWKHVNKWNNSNFRYYNYLYNVIEKNH